MSHLKNLDIAIYLRKSRADVDQEREAQSRGENFDTLAKHRTELLAIAKRDGHTIIDIFEDVVSGEFIAERPDMQQLLEGVKAMRYDAVLVMDIDRLGRGDKIDQGRIERAFKESQTLIVTPSEVYDLNEESGEFNVEMRTFLARFEYRKIKKRLKDGRDRSAREGKDVGQRPPYGYIKDAKKRLHINEEQAKIVRLIYQYCIEGMGRVQIAQRLSEMGIPSPSGKPIWSHVVVRNILNNPKYKGDQVYGRVRWMKQEDGSYKTKRVDPSRYIICENAHDPIIDRETWDLAQEAIKKRITAPVKKDADLINPFAGLIKCSKCGKAVIANNPSNRPNIYLRCGTFGCNQKMIAANKVEKVVLEHLQSILDRLKVTAKQKNKKLKIESVVDIQKKKLEKICEEIKRVRRQKDNLHDLLEDGTYDKETFLDRNRKIQDRLNGLEDEESRIQNQIRLSSSENQSKEMLIPNLERAIDFYKNAKTVREKNELLKHCIQEIRYRREPDWNGDFQFELEIDLFE